MLDHVESHVLGLNHIKSVIVNGQIRILQILSRRQPKPQIFFLGPAAHWDWDITAFNQTHGGLTATWKCVACHVALLHFWQDPMDVREQAAYVMLSGLAHWPAFFGRILHTGAMSWLIRLGFLWQLGDFCKMSVKPHLRRLGGRVHSAIQMEKWGSHLWSPEQSYPR